MRDDPDQQLPPGRAGAAGRAGGGSGCGALTGPALLRAGRLFCKALGAVGAMYFLALNTPMTDVTMALERLHVPHLMVS